MNRKHYDALEMLSIVLISTMIVCFAVLTVYIRNLSRGIVQFNKVDTVYVKQDLSEWNKLLDALVEVESEGNPKAFNERTNAAGILQITPIYVAEVNRLLGEERYSLDDRYDIQKSVEMYCVYQYHKNPQKDIERAIWLHNPTASVKYRNKIIEQL